MKIHKGIDVYLFLSILIVISYGFKLDSIYNQVVVQKGINITSQMEAGIRKSIKDSSLNCTATDHSCFSQIVGMKIQALYGKSWNVHLFQKTTTVIKSQQYSHDRWITLVNEGDPAFSYFIFKPIDCSKPLQRISFQYKQREQIQSQGVEIRGPQKQYWGSSVTASLKSKIKTIIDDAYRNSQLIDKNCEYIQNKLGPGRWEVIIWNTPSFDYFNTCMYASYFGMLIGVQRGNIQWSYYVGRMSLI